MGERVLRRKVVAEPSVLDGPVFVIADDGVSRRAPAGVCPYCDRHRAYEADRQRVHRERRKEKDDAGGEGV